eukprot:scaffold61839_cov20-Tisochrysis_lutea.AAC.1
MILELELALVFGTKLTSCLFWKLLALFVEFHLSPACAAFCTMLASQEHACLSRAACWHPLLAGWHPWVACFSRAAFWHHRSMLVSRKAEQPVGISRTALG